MTKAETLPKSIRAYLVLNGFTEEKDFTYEKNQHCYIIVGQTRWITFLISKNEIHIISSPATIEFDIHKSMIKKLYEASKKNTSNT